MKTGTKRSLWMVLALAAALILVGVLIRRHLLKPWTIMGVVVVQDADTRKQLPIANVEITTTDPLEVAPSRSDSSGFFKLKLSQNLKRGRIVTLRFRHPAFEPLAIDEIVDDKIFVVHLVPSSTNADDVPRRPVTAVGNVQVRYSLKAMRTVNIGSAVKTFQIQNVGNIPCEQQPPCSPDGKWKATVGTATLDAGLGNAFQNARVSCIAGPCPFTRIESDEASNNNQTITASARNWSDPATFLVEAEVVHTMESPIDRQSYPIIYGSALTFTLPNDAEGVSLEADIAGKSVIFPLGPDLYLTWANCSITVHRDETSMYHCDLKPSFRFQSQP